jgi:hypothetical protein
MRGKIQVLRKDSYDAFGFPFIGVVFASDGDTGEAAATVLVYLYLETLISDLLFSYDCDGASNSRPGFTTWLLNEFGRREQSIFLARLNKYARYVHEKGKLSV